MKRPKILSASFVRTINQPDRYGDGRGGHGLSLLAKPMANGRLSKTWSQRLLINGKPVNIGLGAYPLVPLADARRTSLENRQELLKGRDPRGSMPLFSQAAEEVIKIHALGWRDGGKSANQWRASLRDYAMPTIGHKRITTITTSDILALLLQLFLLHYPGTPVFQTKPGHDSITVDDFERLAWAGLEPDRYAWCAVRHEEESGGVHVHVLAARVDLETGKSLNIAPPGWQHAFDPLRDIHNIKHNWARPDDPARAQDVQLGHLHRIDADKFKSGLSAEEHPQEAVTQYLNALIDSGDIHNRDDVLSKLGELGEITRTGKLAQQLNAIREHLNEVDATQNECAELLKRHGQYFESLLPRT